MGRKRRKVKSLTQEDKLKSLIICTKRTNMRKQLWVPKPPPLTQRILNARSSSSNMYFGVRPIYFTKPTTLSLSYDSKLNIRYLYQVFTNVEKIGEGSFGDVFKVVQKSDNKPYAIKITNDRRQSINLSEVEKLEKVPCNEYCVTFHQAWQEHDRLYIMFELCMTSLDKIIKVNHYLTESQCWSVMLDIACGLKFLHDRNLIHMDIKPANIMVTEVGRCKLGDFGLMRDNPLNAATTSRIASSEGDGKYLAPELLDPGTISMAADVFALGMLVLEISSDVDLPASGPTWLALRDGKLPKCFLLRSLTRNFRDMIESMLVRNYEHRPTIDSILNNYRSKALLAQNISRIQSSLVINFEKLWKSYKLKLAKEMNSNDEPPDYDVSTFMNSSSQHDVDITLNVPSPDTRQRTFTPRRLF